ncbi:hypothetical protein BC332_13160 [Capsicum chinense]|nr:hypothetical protein BC332_13160 [Capsicum chinense]
MVNWKIAKPKPRYEDLMEDMLCKVDIKFKQLQTLMMDHYTGIVKVVKEGSTSYVKVRTLRDPPQFHNEHNIDVKTDNIVEDFEQSSKVGGNEEGADERITESVSGYTNKAQEEEMYNTAAELDKGPRDECLKDENIHSMKVALIERSICEIIQGLCIPAGLPWHFVDEVYVPINYHGSFHWILEVIVLKKRYIRVYDSLKGHKGHAVEIKELSKILSTYL